MLTQVGEKARRVGAGAARSTPGSQGAVPTPIQPCERWPGLVGVSVSSGGKRDKHPASNCFCEVYHRVLVLGIYIAYSNNRYSVAIAFGTCLAVPQGVCSPLWKQAVNLDLFHRE